MEKYKMKKYLAIAILAVFVISIMGSVSPKFQSSVKILSGNQKYVSTILPAPPEMVKETNLAIK
jgi:hypothetical protein